jgi:hypothetical protein
MVRIRQYLSTYNLFETRSSTVHTQQRERVSTRLYFFVLISCTITLVFYNGLVERTKTETSLVPSQSTYEHLQSLYPDTLQCPCSNISMPYSTFTVHLNATFHPVCSSVFVSSQWLAYFNIYTGSYVWWIQQHDFRKWGILFFKLIQSLCSLAESAVTDAIEQFQLRSFISSEAMPSIQFQAQVNEALQLFQKSTSTLFARPLQLFRASDQGNSLISLFGSNWTPMFGLNASYAPLLSVPMTYNNGTCSCATSSSCLEPAAFYNYTYGIFHTVDGLFFGCLCLESIFSSTLSCFFSNSCVIALQKSLPLGNPNGAVSTKPINISSLLSLPPASRFEVNDTIETIVYQLFIDSWTNETSYERYYNACAPTHCNYSFGTRLNIIYALTTFLSIFNGLSIGLRFAVPLLVKLAYNLGNCFRT